MRQKFKPKSIPLTDNGYIDFKGKIFLIELNSKGTKAKIQYDGMHRLKQKEFKGFLVYSFKSNLEYFDPNFWNTETQWSSNPSFIYFDTPKLEKNRAKISFGPKFEETFKNKILPYANKHSISTLTILQAIEEECKLNISNEIVFESSDHGIDWFEGYIEVSIKDKKYILTWENCD